MPSFTFGKNEKLCSQKLIGEMFLSGNSFLCYPLKVVWQKVDELQTDSTIQIAFSVPKRIYKRAHDRNRIKRLMRESFRLQKSELFQMAESKELKIALMVVYVGKEILDYAKVSAAMAKAIIRFSKELNI
jgi:ribonuclease P protein component